MSAPRQTPAVSEGEFSSWKEIASYFGRSVRTVQNWEQKRGLPVLRLPGSNGRVYAVRADLEKWKAGAALEAPPKPPLFRVAAAAIAGVLAILVSSWLIMSRSREAGLTWGVEDGRPLTADPGSEAYPDLSPDGNHVVFVSTTDKHPNPSIVSLDLTSGSRQVLASDPILEAHPKWSPSGTLVGYLRSGPTGIHVAAVGVRSRTTRILASLVRSPTIASPTDFSWGPDESSILVSDVEREGQPLAIFSVFPATGQRRRITSPPATSAGDVEPHLSPDRKTLAYARRASDSESDLHVIPIDGGHSRQITRFKSPSSNFAWLPSGEHLMYTARGKSAGSWIVSLSGDAPVRIAASPLVHPTISGSRLVSEEKAHDVNIWRQRLFKGSKPEWVVPSNKEEFNPAVSPDGERIAFISERSGHKEVWIARTDGFHATRLTSFSGPFIDSPRWSPSGDQIAFTGESDGNRDVYIVTVSNGRVSRLTAEPANDGRPSWSWDGKLIYFRSNRSGSEQIWKVESAGGVAAQVTRDGGFEAFESDRELLYYVKARDKGELWQVPANGGIERKALDGVWEGRWGLDGRRLCFLDVPQATPWATVSSVICRPGLERAVRFQIGPTGRGLVAGFAVSKDWVYWSQLDRSDQDLIISRVALVQAK